MTSLKVFTAALAILFSPLGNAALIDQTGNLLDNGSFESGSLNPVSGHSVQSAASSWRQWSNSGGLLTTELITNAEMNSAYGVDVIDGDRAFQITTSGGWDGAFTFDSYNSGGWDTYAELTLSAWVYTIEGTMGLFNGSNGQGFSSAQSTTHGAWEFLSISMDAGRLNNEPLLYSYGESANFIVDSIWLNYGSDVANPSKPVPGPSLVSLFVLGLAGLGVTRGMKKREPLKS